MYLKCFWFLAGSFLGIQTMLIYQHFCVQNTELEKSKTKIVVLNIIRMLNHCELKLILTSWFPYVHKLHDRKKKTSLFLLFSLEKKHKMFVGYIYETDFSFSFQFCDSFLLSALSKNQSCSKRTHGKFFIKGKNNTVSVNMK